MKHVYFAHYNLGLENAIGNGIYTFDSQIHDTFDLRRLEAHILQSTNREYGTNFERVNIIDLSYLGTKES